MRIKLLCRDQNVSKGFFLGKAFKLANYKSLIWMGFRKKGALMGFLEAIQKRRNEALLLVIGLLLFGCVQPPTTSQNNSNITVLREPGNPIEVLALCSASPELRYACNVDAECICEDAGDFNKIYYNYCADKNVIVSDSCGGVGGPRPVACVDHVCTLSYPQPGWMFEQCDELTSEETRIVCKNELAFDKSETEQSEDFCELVKPESDFNRTDCEDIFFRVKAYSTGNSTWCEKISGEYEKRTCNP